MPHLHGEEFQVLCYVTTCDHLVGGSPGYGLLLRQAQKRAGGATSTPTGLKFRDVWGLTVFLPCQFHAGSSCGTVHRPGCYHVFPTTVDCFLELRAKKNEPFLS